MFSGGGVSGDTAGEGVGEDSADAVQSHSIHVLLVDDDTLARHVVRKALEKFGYQGVMPVTHGAKGAVNGFSCRSNAVSHSSKLTRMT